MSIVVSDTSPVRALHHLGLMHVLEQFYQQVFVPPVVVAELRAPPGDFASIDLQGFPFIIIRRPADSKRVNDLLANLDAGEAEAIALAIELTPSMLLIDEAAGRAIASAAGIPHIGVLGILARAKQEAVIPVVRPLLDCLRSELRFRVSDQLYQGYLQSIQE